mgnify:CR=1 FL=1
MFYHRIIVGLSQLHVVTAVLYCEYIAGDYHLVFFPIDMHVKLYIHLVEFNDAEFYYTLMYLFIVPILPLLGWINLPGSLPLRARLNIVLII